jgi:hypothetical protein
MYGLRHILLSLRYASQRLRLCDRRLHEMTLRLNISSEQSFRLRPQAYHIGSYAAPNTKHFPECILISVLHFKCMECLPELSISSRVAKLTAITIKRTNPIYLQSQFKTKTTITKRITSPNFSSSCAYCRTTNRIRCRGKEAMAFS